MQCFTLFNSSWKWSNTIFRIPFITVTLHWVECSSEICSQYLHTKETLPPSSIHLKSAISPFAELHSFKPVQQFVSHTDSKASPVSLHSSASDTPVQAVSAELQLAPALSGTLHTDQSGVWRHSRPAFTLHEQNSLSGSAWRGFSLGV